MTHAFAVDETTRLQQAPDMLVAPVAGELLMMNVEHGNYYVLSSVTARIWELLEAPASVADVIARLVAEYEVDPETCRVEVLQVLQGLADEGVVRLDVP